MFQPIIFTSLVALSTVSALKQTTSSNSNGKNVRRLTDTKATERGGVWSPDGKQVAFAADGGGKSSIFVIDADGRNLRRLTH